MFPRSVVTMMVMFAIDKCQSQDDALICFLAKTRFGLAVLVAGATRGSTYHSSSHASTAKNRR